MDTRLNRKIKINKINRLNCQKYELKKIMFNYLLRIKKTHYNHKKILFYIQQYGKKSSLSMIKNICVFTSRSRGVLKFFKLSRMKLKELGSMGLIPGLKKSSW